MVKLFLSTRGLKCLPCYGEHQAANNHLVLHQCCWWTCTTNAHLLRIFWVQSSCALKNPPSHCSCGHLVFVEHALSSPIAGIPSIRHNEVRDITASLLLEVYHGVLTEPHQHPMSGEGILHCPVQQDGEGILHCPVLQDHGMASLQTELCPLCSSIMYKRGARSSAYSPSAH